MRHERLIGECEEQVWIVEYYLLTVGARGFLGRKIATLFKKFEFSNSAEKSEKQSGGGCRRQSTTSTSVYDWNEKVWNGSKAITCWLRYSVARWSWQAFKGLTAWQAGQGSNLVPCEPFSWLKGLHYQTDSRLCLSELKLTRHCWFSSRFRGEGHGPKLRVFLLH